MEKGWTHEEVAKLVQARKLVKEKGLRSDADVKTICEAAGVSRKTGYQWAARQKQEREEQKKLEKQVKALSSEKSEMENEIRELRFENEGRKLAWEIHEVDEWLLKKSVAKALGKPKR